MPNEHLIAIARQLMDQNTSDERSLEALVAALRRSGLRLQKTMEQMLGSLGVRLLLTQAINGAARRYPFLEGISADEDGLDAAVVLQRKPDADYQEVLEGVEHLLFCFFQLLEDLLGKDLTLLFAREILGESGKD